MKFWRSGILYVVIFLMLVVVAYIAWVFTI
jgi:cbb3-type cytochrome oxidase subunit 3